MAGRAVPAWSLGLGTGMQWVALGKVWRAGTGSGFFFGSAGKPAFRHQQLWGLAGCWPGNKNAAAPGSGGGRGGGFVQGRGMSRVAS